MIEESYKKEGINYRINEPYDPKVGLCGAMDCVTGYNWPKWQTEVVMLEIRNDYCSDPVWRKKHANILAPIIEELQKK
jgi:predicted N-formylglutamate amidohydrolase